MNGITASTAFRSRREAFVGMAGASGFTSQLPHSEEGCRTGRLRN
jgi:hypothetical protein